MSDLQRRIRGGLLMGVTWAVAWVPVGMLTGAIWDPESIERMWVPIGAAPGFLCGVAFSVIVAIAEQHRRFDELSLPRSIAWGALAGFMVGSLPFGISQPTSTLPIWQVGLLVVGPMTVLGAVSGAASLMLARRAERLNFLDSRVDALDPRLIGREARDRVGRG